MKMICRATVLVFVASVLVPVPAAAALDAAAPYSDGAVSLSDVTPPPGGSVNVVASGFRPNSDVDIFFRSAPVLLSTTTANGVGEVLATVVIPSTASGEHQLEVVGVAPDGSARSVSTPVTVTAGADGNLTTPSNPLPSTGNSTTPTVLIAIGVALVGVALLVGTRVRRRARSA